MSTKQIGKVVQCIGAVVDVEFARDQLPKVYDALIIDDKDSTAAGGRRRTRRTLVRGVTLILTPVLRFWKRTRHGTLAFSVTPSRSTVV
jgi:F0F1-type ATP synthase beta subunit